MNFTAALFIAGVEIVGSCPQGNDLEIHIRMEKVDGYTAIDVPSSTDIRSSTYIRSKYTGIVVCTARRISAESLENDELL